MNLSPALESIALSFSCRIMLLRNNTLKIVNSSRADEGNYVCRAENQLGSAEMTASLWVKGKPCPWGWVGVEEGGLGGEIRWGFIFCQISTHWPPVYPPHTHCTPFLLAPPTPMSFSSPSHLLLEPPGKIYCARSAVKQRLSHSGIILQGHT